MPPFRGRPVQFKRENGTGTGFVQRISKPIRQFRNQFLRLNPFREDSHAHTLSLSATSLNSQVQTLKLLNRKSDPEFKPPNTRNTRINTNEDRRFQDLHSGGIGSPSSGLTLVRPRSAPKDSDKLQSGPRGIPSGC